MATRFASCRPGVVHKSHAVNSAIGLSRRLAKSAARRSCTVSCRAASMKDDRVPVTVITGFLGSGKTTLLNHLLTQKHGKRIAVIENEFGEIDIDSQLVASKELLEGTNDTVTQLSNGCLCCTVREDLVKVLVSLHDRRKDFDHIVIETTGLANPAPIISTFFMHEDLPDKVRLDGIVTVVDAKNISRHLDAKKDKNTVSEAVEQIAYADRIILNKVDLIEDKEMLRELQERIATINGVASLQRSEKAVVPVDYVLGVGGFELDTVEKQLAAAMQEHDHSHSHQHSADCAPGCTDPTHDHTHAHAHAHQHGSADCAPGCTDPTHDHGHDHHHHHHEHVTHAGHETNANGHGHSHGHQHAPAHPPAKVHDDRVMSVSLRLDGSMDLDRVNTMLGGLLSTRSEDMYRIKGILSIDGSDERYVYHGVHDMFEGNPDRKWMPDEKRQCQMVFIGRDLDKDMFKEAFTRCLATPQPAMAR